MDIKIYNNTIMAPVKCGTRYLDKIWEAQKLYHTKTLTFPKVKYIIIRDPLSHLISALHTEIVEFINKYGKSDDYYYKLKNFISPDGTNHWCVSFYEYLYYYRNKHGNDIQVVKLENLTQLLKNLGYNYTINTNVEKNKWINFSRNIYYTPEEYNFNDYKTWMPKEELFEMLKVIHSSEINWLIDKVEIQNIYYNKLINNEIDTNQSFNKIML